MFAHKKTPKQNLKFLIAPESEPNLIRIRFFMKPSSGLVSTLRIFWFKVALVACRDFKKV